MGSVRNGVSRARQHEKTAIKYGDPLSRTCPAVQETIQVRDSGMRSSLLH